jgi:hypothetical protein
MNLTTMAEIKRKKNTILMNKLSMEMNHGKIKLQCIQTQIYIISTLDDG